MMTGLGNLSKNTGLGTDFSSLVSKARQGFSVPIFRQEGLLGLKDRKQVLWQGF